MVLFDMTQSPNGATEVWEDGRRAIGTHPYGFWHLGLFAACGDWRGIGTTRAAHLAISATYGLSSTTVLQELGARVELACIGPIILLGQRQIGARSKTA